MRTFTVLLVASILALGTQAFGQEEEEKAPIDIPVYPNAEVTTEVNLRQEDILPMLQATLPLISSGLSKTGLSIQAEEIAPLLKDIRQIEFIQLEAKTRRVALAQIIDFYARNLPNGTWKRVLYASQMDSGVVAIYCDADAESYYGFQIRVLAESGKHVKQVSAAKIVGRIDFARLMSLIAKFAQSVATQSN